MKHRPISNIEAAEMAERAAFEIKELRAQNAVLAPQAEAYEMLKRVLLLLPQQGRGFEEDFAYKLEARAMELRSVDTE